MEASPTIVTQYLSGEKQNLIPMFQRPYSWKQANWQTLWDDILVQYDADKPSTHFMGAIVSIPARSVPVGVSKFLIIDGQQRLTTLSVLLCSLRDVVEKNTSGRIHEVYLVNKFRDADEILKFVPTQIDRAAYKALVLKEEGSLPKSGIIDAYEFFKKKIQGGLDLDAKPIDPERVLAVLERNLQVVMINLGDADDPYLIFESLNFKGEPLTQADLVRNYILMQFRHSMQEGGEQERVFNQYWRPLESQMSEQLTEFLRYYAMRSGENVYLGGIYSAIKQRFRAMETSAAVEEELRVLRRFGSHFSKILAPMDEARPNIRRRLLNIRNLEVATSYSLLLRLFDENANGNLSDEDLERCLGLVESFIVRRAVCGVPTNALNKIFLQLCRTFPASAHYVSLREALSAGNGGRRFPGDAEFSDAFTKQRQYGRGATRFILNELERAFNHKEAVDLSTCTIEHIMPQTMTPEWEAEIGDGHAEIHEELIDTIGNLTLTAYNSELGNMPFPDKKMKLSDTHIEMTRLILLDDKWGREQISRRAARLGDMALKLWTGPTEVASGV